MWKRTEGGGWQERKRRNSQGEDPRTFLKKTAGEGAPKPQIETASLRTQEPLKNPAREGTQALLKVEAIRCKGGEFKKSGRNRGGRRGTNEKEREEGEA